MEAAICLIVSTGFLETLDKEVPPDQGGKITLFFFYYYYLIQFQFFSTVIISIS